MHAYIVTDIGYGDAGKGTTVDYLVRQAKSAVVVRHNGGPQAAHNVITPDGRHHTFAQFGSGSFVPSVRTHLSRFMLVNPLNMLQEAEHLGTIGVSDIWERTTVDEGAAVILPWHQAGNKLRELTRGDARHGSCGQGVGEAQADRLRDPASAVYVRDLRDPVVLRQKLVALRDAKYEQLHQELAVPSSLAAMREWYAFHDPTLIPWLCDVYAHWANRVAIVNGDHLRLLANTHEYVVFEGAQGVLLDEDYGFHPHTTWSKTTPENAQTLLAGMHYSAPVTSLGIMRAYTTRHGAGPFVTEDAGLAAPLAEYHNGVGEWQGSFRYGHLDLVAHHYAVAACQGLDGLVVTGLDRMAALPRWHYCASYRIQGSAPADMAQYFRHGRDGNVNAIKLGSRNNRAYQQRLGELVAHCSPVGEAVDAPSGSNTVHLRQQALLSTIEDHLGLAVRLTSHGPTAAGKRALALC